MRTSVSILLFLFCTISFGQKYNFKRFSVEEGLPQPGLFCLEEDNIGQLWVGLDNGGVEIFDGWKFTTVDTRLTGKNIRALFKSSKGEMWVGSSADGITIFGQDTIHLGHEQGLISNHIRSFCEDLNGRIWVSTMGGGVQVFEDKKLFKTFSVDSVLLSSNSRTVLCHRDGNVWVGTDNGIVIFKDYQVLKSLRKSTRGLTGNRILALEPDEDGNVWVGSDKGLDYVASDTILSFNNFFGVKEKRVKAILVDVKNQVWIGTKNGLGCLRNINHQIISTASYSLKWYTEDNGLSNDRIRCLYEDQSKALWIGTYFGGISKFFNNSFSLYTKGDGMAMNVVNAVQCNPLDSSLWIGTDGAGLTVWGTHRWALNTDKGLSNNNVTCFHVFKSGEALVGTEEGLNLVVENQVVKVWDSYDEFYEGSRVTHLVANDSIALVLTDQHSLMAIEATGELTYSEHITKEVTKLVGKKIYALSFADNQFWIAGPDQLHSLKIEDGLVQELHRWDIKNVDGLAGDDDLKLGFTSNSKLFAIDENERVHWVDTLREYKDVQFVIEGLRDSKGVSFWIGVNKGVVNLIIKNGEVVNRKNYSIDEGFMGVQSFKNSAVLNFDGSIFVGTVKGLLKIEPNSYKGVKRDLKVNLKGILFQGDKMDLTPYSEGIKEGIPIGLKLPHNKDNITFQISAIHLKNPKEVKYKYKLKGWDEEFKVKFAEESKGEGNIFNVDYDHIAAGHYEFVAYAKTPYGSWSKTPLSVKFEIRPIWWKNPYYILGLSSVLIGLLIFMIINRTKRLIREKENLELLVAERTKDLSSEKQKSEKLLLNILPIEIAEELKLSGSAKTKSYDQASVLFTDFKGFTHLSMELTAEELVAKLDEIFVSFDEVIERNSLEKIKTIGDAYMCASGIPKTNKFQERNIVIAGIQLIDVMKKFNRKQQSLGKPEWHVRVGIHTGELIAGVVGKKKFAYDIWGDTVNIASRMESSGAVGQVNISESTYKHVKEYFEFEIRGKVAAKNKGDLEMYFVNGIKKEYQDLDSEIFPNENMFKD